MAARKPAAQPAPVVNEANDIMGTFDEDEMSTLLRNMRDSMGQGEFVDWLQGQVLFYTLAAPRSKDSAKAARKAAYFAEIYATEIQSL